MISNNYAIQLSEALNARASIPNEEVDKLIKIAHIIKINRNDYFIRAGEIQPWLGFVIFGVFRGFLINDTGVEYTKYFCCENTFMVAYTISLVDNEFINKESEYYFQALEDSIILKFDLTEFKTLLNHSCWQEFIAKGIERVYKIKEQRIRQLLLDDAENRYLNFIEDFPGLENRIKQSHIASYIGVSPVTLSRIRTKFKSN